MRLMVVKRHGVVGLLASAFTAVILAMAPATCSESSEADGPSCKTVFGHSSVIP